MGGKTEEEGRRAGDRRGRRTRGREGMSTTIKGLTAH